MTVKRKLPALFTALALTAACLSGCGEELVSEDANTLTFFIKKSDIETVYVSRIINLYEEKTGNKIKPIAVKNVDFEKRSAEVYGSDVQPDLSFHYNDSFLNSLDIANHFYYLNDQPWVDELTAGTLENCLDSKGNVLGLPFWENSLSGCYYNKKILDELGLRPASTQAGFDTLCKTLKALGYTPMYWACNDCNWIFQFGLDPIFADDPQLLEKLNKNEITYAEIPAVRDMISWLDNANKQGWFNADHEKAVWDDIAPAVENGDAVFLFVWDTWFDTNFRDDGKYKREDFAVMPVFMNTVETGTYEGGNMNMLMVNKNSEKLELALDFLNFCASPENYNVAFDGISTVNCFKNQTTNIQSKPVTDAAVSIEANRRASTAWLKIIGYRQNDVGDAVLKMFKGEVDVDGCLGLMDEYRIAAAKEAGAEGF